MRLKLARRSDASYRRLEALLDAIGWESDTDPVHNRDCLTANSSRREFPLADGGNCTGIAYGYRSDDLHAPHVAALINPNVQQDYASC